MPKPGLLFSQLVPTTKNYSFNASIWKAKPDRDQNVSRMTKLFISFFRLIKGQVFFHLAATKNRHKRKVEKPLTRFAAFFAFLPPQSLFKAFYLSNIIAQGRRSASYCSLHKRVFTCQMFFGHLSQLSISLSIYFYLTTFYLSPCSTHELRQNKICCPSQTK